MSSTNKSIGKIGETLACDFLINHGYSIIKRNYTCKWGEIDIIAGKHDKVIFFEVKTRISQTQGQPYEAITGFKVRHLYRSIQYFLLQQKCKPYKLCLDAISILLNSDYTLKELKHYENIQIPN